MLDWQKYNSTTNMQMSITNDENDIYTEMVDFKIPSFSKDAINYWESLKTGGSLLNLQ